jgi:hypothetical protein
MSITRPPGFLRLIVAAPFAAVYIRAPSVASGAPRGSVTISVPGEQSQGFGVDLVATG